MNYGDTKGVTASCVRDFPLGGGACFRLFAGICAAPLGVFVAVSLCAAPLFSCLRALSFGFCYDGCFFFLLTRVLCYLRLFCSCLRYFVVVDGSLCPLIGICFCFLFCVVGVFVRKQDVVNAVAAQVTMTPRDVRAVLAGIDMVVGEAVMRGEDVTLGFVKFEPVTLPPRVQRLPSGELKELGERRRVKARPCKSLRDRVAGESVDD